MLHIFVLTPKQIFTLNVQQVDKINELLQETINVQKRLISSCEKFYSKISTSK